MFLLLRFSFGTRALVLFLDTKEVLNLTLVVRQQRRFYSILACIYIKARLMLIIDTVHNYDEGNQLTEITAVRTHIY